MIPLNLICVLFVVGACVGSFLGVLIYRLPHGKVTSSRRSACESCSTVLGLYDLVPLASFIWLKRRCRFCGVPIRWELFTVEIAGALVALVSGLAASAPSQIVPEALLGWGLLTLAWIDARHLILPDAITLPLLVAGLLTTWFLDPSDLIGHVSGAVAGYVVLRGVNFLYRAIRHHEGIGHGDAKLLAVAGAWVGWALLPWILVIGSILGISYAILIGAFRKREIFATMQLPFGTFLAPSIFSVYVFKVAFLASTV